MWTNIKFNLEGEVLYSNNLELNLILIMPPSFKNGVYELKCEWDDCLMKLWDVAFYYLRLTIPHKGPLLESE